MESDSLDQEAQRRKSKSNKKKEKVTPLDLSGEEQSMSFELFGSDDDFSIDREANTRYGDLDDRLERLEAAKKRAQDKLRADGGYEPLREGYVADPERDAALDVVIDNPPRHFAIAGLHDLIVELDWLQHYLLKKHTYPKVFFSETVGKWVWGPKYERKIRESVETIERLITDVESSLGCVEQYPQLAAYLMNREKELEHTQNWNGFAVEYKENFNTLKDAFARIKNLKHVDRENRDVNFVRATQQIMDVKRACKFRHIDEGSESFNPHTYNFNKDIAKSLAGKEPSHKSTKEQDKHASRYIRVNDTEKEISIWEKIIRSTIHRARGKGQQRVVTAVTVVPSLSLAVPTGLLAHTLPHYVGPAAGYTSSVGGGVAGMASLYGAVKKWTENWWMKRYHTTTTASDNVLTKGIKPRSLAPQQAVEEDGKQTHSAVLLPNSNIDDQNRVDGEGRGITEQIRVNAESQAGTTLAEVPSVVLSDATEQHKLSATRNALDVVSFVPPARLVAIDEDRNSPFNRIANRAKQLAGAMDCFLYTADGAVVQQVVHPIPVAKQNLIKFDDRDEATQEDRERKIADTNHKIAQLNLALHRDRDNLDVHHPMTNALNMMIDNNQSIPIDTISQKIDELNDSIRRPRQAPVGYQAVAGGIN